MNLYNAIIISSCVILFFIMLFIRIHQLTKNNIKLKNRIRKYKDELLLASSTLDSLKKHTQLIYDQYQTLLYHTKQNKNLQFTNDNNNFIPKPKKIQYNIDDILDEINMKGINNVSEEKLNYLKNNKK